MYLKNDRIIVNVGGLTFKSHSDNKVSHFRLDPTAVQGWDDGVDVRRDTAVRPTSWGDFSEKGRLSSRLVTISGTAIAQNPAELHQMRDKFIKICADGSFADFSLENAYDVRFATVTLGSKPSWIQLIDTAAVWKLDLYAPDPRIYGAELRVQVTDSLATSGGMSYPMSYAMDYHIPSAASSYGTITNKGNVESFPKFVVTGDFISGFSVSNGNGVRVAWSGHVTNFAPVTVDMRKGSVLQNGVDRSDLLIERNWFSVAPGETIQPKFTAVQPGGGWCDILFRNTWI